MWKRCVPHAVCFEQINRHDVWKWQFHFQTCMTQKRRYFEAALRKEFIFYNEIHLSDIALCQGCQTWVFDHNVPRLKKFTDFLLNPSMQIYLLCIAQWIRLWPDSLYLYGENIALGSIRPAFTTQSVLCRGDWDRLPHVRGVFCFGEKCVRPSWPAHPYIGVLVSPRAEQTWVEA